MDIVTYKELKKQYFVECDICDKVFTNRFDRIRHNINHIIIPLTKCRVLVCNICNSSYASQFELDKHYIHRHPDDCVKKDRFEEYYEEVDIIKPLLPNLQVNTGDTLEPLKYNTTDHFKSWFTPKHGPCGMAKYKRKSIIDNLVLDEPLTDEYICDGFVDCDSETDDYKNADSDHNKSNLDVEVISLGDEEDGDEEECDDKDKFENIHYSILMEPGIYICKYCTNSFPNRFSLLKHQVVHLKVTTNRVVLCPCCNIHERKNNKETFKSLKFTKNICKPCFTINQPREKVYVKKGTYKSENGLKLRCERCLKHFTELKLVHEKPLSNKSLEKKKKNQ